MKNLFRFILFILVCAKTTAQYTDIINSNRPGHTENAYSIGKNIIQIENGVSLIFNKYNHSPLQLSYQNNLNIRSGILFEQIEVKAEFVHGIQNIVPIKFKYNLYNTNPSPIYSYLDNTIEFKNIGFKFLAYDHKIKNHNDEIRSWNKRTAFNWSKFIPSIAIKAEYINRKKSDGFEGIGASILLHHKVNSIWNILSNFGYNISKNGVNAEYVASISTNYAFNNNWSSFAETYNIITETKNTYQIAFGFAYLVSKNLQIDFSSRISYF
ncbi:MAG: transporter, partial [Flavicella sp.]